MTQNPNDPQSYASDPTANYGNESMAAPKNSVAALVGLIAGATSLIPCLGFVTGPVGLISSIIGFFTTGNPSVKGRWMAVVGVLLSLVGFIGMNVALLGGVGYWGFQKSMAAVNAPSETFLQALVDNDISAAQAASTGFSDAELNAFADQFDAVGDAATIEFSMNGFNLQVNNAGAVGTVTGTASGDGNTLSFTTDVEGTAELTNMKVTDLEVR